jgi:hypothetical protein
MLKLISELSLSAAFISVATLRYYYQYGGTSKNSEKGIPRQRERQQAMLMED